MQQQPTIKEIPVRQSTTEPAQHPGTRTEHKRSRDIVNVSEGSPPQKVSHHETDQTVSLDEVDTSPEPLTDQTALSPVFNFSAHDEYEEQISMILHLRRVVKNLKRQIEEEKKSRCETCRRLTM